MVDHDSGYAAPGKRELRAQRRARRRQDVPARDRAFDAEWIAARGLDFARSNGLHPGDWVAAYESTPLEPPTDLLVERLLAAGLRVMVPITLADLDLDWSEAGDPRRAPLGRDAIGRAKVVFVPASGVDPTGTRIGQGGGCYDRALPRTSAPTVALVHPWEVGEEALPREPHDQPVGAVITSGADTRTF